MDVLGTVPDIDEPDVFSGMVNLIEEAVRLNEKLSKGKLRKFANLRPA